MQVDFLLACLIVAERQSGCAFDCRFRWRSASGARAFDRLFSTVAIDIHFEDRGMMHEAVDCSEGHCLVREDPSPFGKWLICGDHQ